jgi:hypothetical protein
VSNHFTIWATFDAEATEPEVSGAHVAFLVGGHELISVSITGAIRASTIQWYEPPFVLRLAATLASVIRNLHPVDKLMRPQG